MLQDRGYNTPDHAETPDFFVRTVSIGCGGCGRLSVANSDLRVGRASPLVHCRDLQSTGCGAGPDDRRGERGRSPYEERPPIATVFRPHPWGRGAAGIRWRVRIPPDPRRTAVFFRPCGALGCDGLPVPTVETVGYCRSPLWGGWADARGLGRSPSPQGDRE